MIHELIITAILAVTIMMAGLRRIKILIGNFMIQALGISILFALEGRWTLVFLTIGTKFILIPWIAWKTVHKLKIKRELEMYLDVYQSYIVTMLGMVIIYLLFRNSNNSLVKIGIVIMFVGSLLMIARKKAITQMMGLLVLENGLLLLETSLTEMPLVIEISIIFEILLLSLVMGLMIFQIKQTFDSIEIEHLTMLKE